MLISGENPEGIYLVLSALVIAILQYWRYTGKLDKTKAWLHTAIVGWSGLMYSNFILQVYNPSFTYYFDWIISTPLLVLALIYASTGELGEKAYAASLTQFLVIFTGLIASKGSMSMPFFLMSTGLLIGLFIQLYKLETYKKKPVLHSILLLTWISYPVIWLVYSGNLLQTNLELVLLPLVSKHLFALWDGIYSED